MRIPLKISTLSTSIILTLAALTLFLAPIQTVQALIYRQGAPFWYPTLILTIIFLRSFIAFGLFERKSWAWLLYSLDKILFLALYAMRFVQAESLPYTEEARQALMLPVALTTAKLLIALLAYREFTPNFKKHLIELVKNWRSTPAINKIMQEVKTTPFIRIALSLYFALTLGSQAMGQLYTTILLWAGITDFDTFFVLLAGSMVFFALAAITTLRYKTWGWKLIIAVFTISFLFSLPSQLKLNKSPLQNFWIRRTETALSFLWLSGTAFWLAQPQKGKLSLGKKRN